MWPMPPTTIAAAGCGSRIRAPRPSKRPEKTLVQKLRPGVIAWTEMCRAFFRAHCKEKIRMKKFALYAGIGAMALFAASPSFAQLGGALGGGVGLGGAVHGPSAGGVIGGVGNGTSRIENRANSTLGRS